MSFDQDPNEQANISGADLAILVDELKSLRAANEALTADVENAAKDIEYWRKKYQDLDALYDKLEEEKQAYKTALLKILTAVQKYLPPDGISKDELITEVIATVDPWPISGKPMAKPLKDEAISLIAHNLDDGDWSDLNYKDCWHKGFFAGFREAEIEHGISAISATKATSQVNV